MAIPSTHAGHGKTEIHPALLFQSPSAQERASDGGFENVLNRALEPERAETPRQPSQSAPQNTAREPARSGENAAPASETPAERTPQTAERGSEAPADESHSATPQDGTTGNAAEAGQAIASGLPAEIAAMLAALSAVQRAARPEGAAVDADALVLDTDAGGGRKGQPGQTATLATALLGKDDAADGRAPAAPRETLVQQAVTLATQSGPTRGFADQLAAGLRGEAMPGLQAAGLPFAARGEASQPLPQLPVTTPAGQRAWAAEVGNQVAWMVGRNESKAELVLTPSSLGKLGVSIQVNGDQTTAHFVAATPAAREALEQAMPRLREVLQQAGIHLGHTDVSTSGDQRTHDGGQDGGARHAGSGAARDSGSADAGGGLKPANPTTWVHRGNGVIDTFA